MPKKQLKDVDDHHCGDDQIYWGSIRVRTKARAEMFMDMERPRMG